MAMVPFQLLTVSAIMLLRLSWGGTLTLAVIFSVTLISILVIKVTVGFKKGVNLHKDKRVSHFSQLIGGIKYIKMYGW